MTNITEDYVSFETAKLLKEKGFDGECRDYYNTVGHFYSEDFKSDWNDSKGEITFFSAPTLQMAMKWLREVHKLYVEVYIVKNHSNKTIEYCITIEDLNFPGNKDGFHIRPSQESYEDACKVAIKYCLEHLI